MTSDQYYRERADRQRNTILAALVIILTLACLYGIIFGALRDGCTRSFDRQPNSVVESYLEAFAAGDLAAAERCWHKYAYYEIETGCSEICMSRNLGGGFSLHQADIGTEVAVGTSREQLEVTVSITCPSGEVEQGELTLDSVRADVPWKHWKISASTIGGTLAEPWCDS